MGMIIQNGKLFSGEPKTTYKERILWSGPATPSTSGLDITLSDDITNYDEIVFDLTSETGRKYQDNYFVSSLTIGSTYLEALYAAESQGVFWTYTNETSINIKRITTGKETTITYNKITGIKYGDTVKRKDYHVYSTEEQIVGEWIDGSDLYQRTIKVDNVPYSTGVQRITIPESSKYGIMFVLDAYAIAGTAANGLFLTHGFIFTDNRYVFLAWCENGGISYRYNWGNSSTPITTMYIRIRYTKPST